jgi:SNF2 domain-containing protein/helicase-like protein
MSIHRVKKLTQEDNNESEVSKKPRHKTSKEKKMPENVSVKSPKTKPDPSDPIKKIPKSKKIQQETLGQDNNKTKEPKKPTEEHLLESTDPVGEGAVDQVIEKVKNKKPKKPKMEEHVPERADPKLIAKETTMDPVEKIKTKKPKKPKDESVPEIRKETTPDPIIETVKSKKSKKPKDEPNAHCVAKETTKDDVEKVKNNLTKSEEKKEQCIKKPKKTLKKHQKVEIYLTIIAEQLSNQAVVLRSNFPSLVLYRSKYFRNMNIIESCCKEYLKDKASLTVTDIDWVPPTEKINRKSEDSDDEDSTNDDDKTPPSPSMMFFLDEKDWKEEDDDQGFGLALKFELPQNKSDEILKHHFEKRLQKIFEHPEFKPFPYQLTFYNHWFKYVGSKIFNDQNGVDAHEAYLLYWKMGAGKSSASLYPWSKNYVKRVYILCVNTMIEPWVKFVISMSQPPKSTTRFIILGLTEFGKLAQDNIEFLKDEIVIFDEAHMFRNLTTSMNLEIDALIKAKVLINLTGTPIVNARNNLIGLGKIMMYNFSTAELILLNSPDYENNDIQNQIIDLIRKIFTNKVHFCDPSIDKEKYAPLTVEIKEVEMSWQQTVDYLVHKKQTFQIGGISIGSSRRNSYHNAQKRLSNTDIHGSESPKFTMIIKDTLDMLRQMPITGNKQQIIYSNFLGNGIFPLYNGIKKEKFLIAIATGDSSTQERNESFHAYNTKSVNVLSISSVGGLGLTFRNTDVLRLTDSFENIPMENQCIHRISRIGAHDVKQGEPLPNVLVVKYISIFPKKYTSEESKQICDYFYKQYCEVKWGTKQHIFECSEETFIDLLIEKIVEEEDSETIDQKLLKSNQTKELILIPLSKEVAMLGTMSD